MRKILVHIIFWIVFFLMWNQVMYFYIRNNLSNRLYFSALDVSLIILAFYGIFSFVLPDYFRRKKKVRLIILSVSLIVLLTATYTWCMKLFLNHMLIPIQFDFIWTYQDLQYNRFFIVLLGVLGGYFVKLAIDRLDAQRKLESMEKERSLAELTYLKAQINPHFLFNSLNTLYSQLDIAPSEARHTLVSISDLLRYQLYECSTDFTPLTKELDYLNNYFNIQQLRIENCNATFTVKGNPEQYAIAPLLMMPLVENAFKYLSDSDVAENRLALSIVLRDDQLSFRCENTFDSSSFTDRKAKKGIGLENVKKRLELLYQGRYQLQTTVDGRLYIVTLTLNLTHVELPDHR
ncbi:histidine kinase [Chitinophaga dinghuensis]|uniref:Histidine kinase n=1 Tax=Chitinophaga dinghuensis TaxID=1539050 RepID=A0A327VZ04_9BACT|nr:histidine kinase [Chitinophaga dinghuensis]RAJ82267.1 histidine kinase [Chitinophaga dinghuensis]